jgi:hypothetical protein
MPAKRVLYGLQYPADANAERILYCLGKTTYTELSAVTGLTRITLRASSFSCRQTCRAKGWGRKDHCHSGDCGRTWRSLEQTLQTLATS